MPKTKLTQLREEIEWREVRRIEAAKEVQTFVTHCGIMAIGNWRLRCYRLSDGREAVDLGDADAFLEGGDKMEAGR